MLIMGRFTGGVLNHGIVTVLGGISGGGSGVVGGHC